MFRFLLKFCEGFGRFKILKIVCFYIGYSFKYLDFTFPNAGIIKCAFSYISGWVESPQAVSKEELYEAQHYLTEFLSLPCYDEDLGIVAQRLLSVLKDIREPYAEVYAYFNNLEHTLKTMLNLHQKHNKDKDVLKDCAENIRIYFKTYPNFS